MGVLRVLPGHEVPNAGSERPLKVVVIDDSRAIRRQIARELAPLGADIYEAEDGTRGLALVRHLEPDLVTLDIEMPGPSGYEVCEDLRASPETMATPIVVIGSRGRDEQRLKALAAGANGYYLKPFAPGALRTFVKDLVAETRRHQAARIFVVEDQRLMRKQLTALLSDAGFDHEVFEHPDAALEAFREEAPDLLLLALDMPDHASLRMLCTLREEPAFERLPVVGLTASPARKDVLVAFRAGATDLLRKPFFPEELVVRVTNQLRVFAAQNEVHKSATIDPLTQVYNRRELERLFEVERARALRARTPLGVFIIDLDHFKVVNDTHGHPAGDVVLQRVSREIFTRLRATDILGRFGGEEFVALLPNCPPLGVGHLAERVRLSLETLSVDIETTTLDITASVGGTSWDPDSLPDAATFAEFLEPADKALYASKDSGRNRVTVYSPEGEALRFGRTGS